MNVSKRLTVAQALCRPLPPIISQKIRSIVYPFAIARRHNREVLVRSQTGSTFVANSGDFHGYPFSVHGYSEWRHTAIALAVAGQGDTIVEIGANVGTETIGFSDIVGPRGRVYAFEPLPSNLKALYRTRQCATQQNICVYPVALSNEIASIKFVVPQEHESGMGHLVQAREPIIETSTIEVNCTTLDYFVASVAAARLIFIDAEGEEVRILQGAKAFIKRFEPVIVLEASPQHLGRAGFQLSDLCSEIRDLGYRPYAISRWRLNEIKIARFDRCCNWLCVPSGQETLVWRVQKYLTRCALMPCMLGLNPLQLT
jgi:FkbM family methyltransferase